MGTYAVTHVKKDNKIISFSDSYDGYLGGGMGQANIEGIKYFPIELLKELFDKYTASEKIAVENLKNSDADNENGNRHNLDNRYIENAIYEFAQSINDEEGKDWFSDIVSGGISTSKVGFAPLLYLDVNNHYALDYDYCDYMIDLDNELFIHNNNGITLSFSKIKNATITQLNTFCNVADLFSENINKEVEEFWDNDLTALPTNEAQAQSEKILDLYCSLDDKIIDKHYSDLKDKQEKYIMENYSAKHDLHDEDHGVNVRSSSVHSANFGIFKLISTLTLMQKLKANFPETAFLLDNSQWGVSQDYAQGGIDIFSPNSKDKLANKIYTDFIMALQSHLKIYMNVRSSASAGFNDDDDFMDSSKPEEKSMMNLNEISKMEGFDNVVEQINFYLAIHAPYDDVRQLLLTKKPDAPVMWLYVALINQDKEVFQAIYQYAKEEVSKAADTQNIDGVYIQYLNCLNEGNRVTEFIDIFGKTLDDNYQPKGNEEFVSYLKNTEFFQDVSSVMTNAEKAKYGLDSSRTKMKM